VGCVAARSWAAEDEHAGKALIAITLDLEMSRNFPTWEETHWDYEKGNLNDETKRYTVEACKLVKEAGGVLHCFAVGQTLEQPNVDWLAEIARAGHPIGNHTYDHVNLLATKAEEIQFRFRRSPWLIAGRTAEQVIVENIRMTNAALKSRLGIEAAGFRTPGGIANGLADRADVRHWLRELGFSWISSKYPRHAMTEAGQPPSEEFVRQIVALQEQAQPFVYSDGLVEIPMSPVSDIGAFRTGRWKLDWFLKVTRRAVESVIERRGVFDFLGHPSCLYVMDPQMKTIEMIVNLVKKSQGRGVVVDLGTIAKRVETK
jgi:peptidoglycan/xylan/chitin deacetylase (PgdA/CDA1 family)